MGRSCQLDNFPVLNWVGGVVPVWKLQTQWLEHHDVQLPRTPDDHAMRSNRRIRGVYVHRTCESDNWSANQWDTLVRPRPNVHHISGLVVADAPRQPLVHMLLRHNGPLGCGYVVRPHGWDIWEYRGRLHGWCTVPAVEDRASVVEVHCVCRYGIYIIYITIIVVTMCGLIYCT